MRQLQCVTYAYITAYIAAYAASKSYQKILFEKNLRRR